MAQKKKISISSSEKRRSLSASKSKKKLGDKSLSWITDTTEGEVILNAQGENLQDKSAGSSKESKIGVMKQYVSEGVEKKKGKTPEVIPGISGSSSTITKGKKIIRKKSPVYIGLKNLHQLWKRRRRASQEEKISKEDKTPSKKKKTVELAAKEEIPPTEKRIWMKISGIGGALKKGGKKASGAVVKPLESDKTKLRKSASSIINVSKQPVKSISAFDRKITQSMKKVVSFSDNGIAKKSILENIKSADTQITKSTKKMIDSILGNLPIIKS